MRDRNGMGYYQVMWNDVTYFVFVMTLSTLNRMEENITEVSMGWISECGRLFVMRVEKYALNNSAVPMRKKLKMIKFRTADELGRKQALKI